MLLSTLREKIAASDFIKNAAKLMAGTVIAQVITVMASPLLTRLYTPADFGTFSFYSSIVAVITIVASGRYDMAVVVAKNFKSAINILFLAAAFILLTSILTFGAAFAFRQELNTLLHVNNGWALVWLLPLTVLFLGIYQLIAYWANRQKDFSIIAASKVLQNILNVSFAIGYGFLFKSQLGLVLGFFIGSLAAFSTLLIKYFNPLLFFRKEVSRVRLKYVMSYHRQFPAYSMPSSFLDTFSNQAPIFFITIFFGNVLAGYYGFAIRIISIPVTLIGASIAQVFFQKLSEEFRNKGNCTKLIYQTWGSLALIGLLPCVLLILLGPQLFSFIFGEEWGQAGRMAQYLALMQFFVLVSSPTSTAMIVFGAQQVSFFFGLASAVYRPLALYIGYLLGDFNTGLIILVICEILQIISYNLLILHYNKKLSSATVKSNLHQAH